MNGSGVTVTFGELNRRSNAIAHVLRAHGIERGDHIALLMENNPWYHAIVWAALRSGIYVTPINWHLVADEVSYIIQDCGARAFVTSSRFAPLTSEIASVLDRVESRFCVDGNLEAFESFESAVSAQPTTPIDDQSLGAIMFYSSGTTGRPKGIKQPLSDNPIDARGGMDMLLEFLYGATSDSVYLSPAPLYHAAPLVWSLAAQRIGATVIVMEHFDPEETLAAIERHRVTHAQFVPTHFIRMLKLDESVRHKYDLSSLKMAVHAAAPCPIEAKRAMLEWWGPVIWEYYAGSEGNGYCSASPEEWLAHPGTVGKMITGKVHIMGEDGEELPVGEPGLVYFESGAQFKYHNDEEKTASAYNAHGWSTLNDIGYLDADDFLYLTDRASHMIISGGVNIYPQEVESLLALHPAVLDVAVIGVPDPDLGETVLAVIHAAPDAKPSEALGAELIAYCQAHLAKFKCPRRVDFVDDLPRLPNGKLLKRQLRDRYQ